MIFSTYLVCCGIATTHLTVNKRPNVGESQENGDRRGLDRVSYLFRLGYAKRRSLIVSMCGQVRMEGVGLMHKSHSEESGTGFLPTIEKKIITT